MSDNESTTSSDNVEFENLAVRPEFVGLTLDAKMTNVEGTALMREIFLPTVLVTFPVDLAKKHQDKVYLCFIEKEGKIEKAGLLLSKDGQSRGAEILLVERKNEKFDYYIAPGEWKNA